MTTQITMQLLRDNAFALFNKVNSIGTLPVRILNARGSFTTDCHVQTSKYAPVTETEAMVSFEFAVPENDVTVDKRKFVNLLRRYLTELSEQC